MTHAIRFAAVGIALMTAACRVSLEPTVLPLDSVFQLTAASGVPTPLHRATILLLRSGTMEESRIWTTVDRAPEIRRSRYQLRDGTLSVQYIETGPWLQRGVLRGDTLKLSYVGPGDGLIRETYVRAPAP